MKLAFKILVLLLVIQFTSGCKKDEVNSPVKMVGTWKMTDLNTDDGESSYYDDFFEDTISYTYMFHAKNFNTTTTFTENPNEFTSDGSYTLVLTTNFFGVMNTTETTVQAFAGTGTWSIQGNTFTQNFGGSTSEFEILSLSDNELKLKEELNVLVDDQGTTVHNVATVYSTFEKQ